MLCKSSPFMTMVTRRLAGRPDHCPWQPACRPALERVPAASLCPEHWRWGFYGASVFGKKQNRCCAIFTVGKRVLPQWSAARTHCELGVRLCVCVTFPSAGRPISQRPSMHVSVGQALSSQYVSKNYFNLSSPMRKDKTYLLYIPDETLIWFDN